MGSKCPKCRERLIPSNGTQKSYIFLQSIRISDGQSGTDWFRRYRDWKCNSCGRTFNGGTSWHCANCNYDACLYCLPPDRGCCPARHALKYQGYSSSNNCDRCRENITSPFILLFSPKGYRCDQCDFDLCERCFSEI